jgi:hypothetical protein
MHAMWIKKGRQAIWVDHVAELLNPIMPLWRISKITIANLAHC